MTFVTTAIGGKHRGFAAKLADSFRRWGWPRLIVIADAAVEGCEAVIVKDDSRGGRRSKILFATHLPPLEGPVFFLDCDCEATGPYLGAPELLPGQMAGIIRKTYLTSPRSHLLCSALMGFHNAEEALALGKEWWRQYNLTGAESRQHLRDEYSLYRATRKRGIIHCGSITQPLPHLRHRLITSGGERRRDYSKYFDFADIYDEVVNHAPSGATLVEIGVWQGQSLDYLSGAALKSGKRLRVVGYDIFDPGYYLGTPAPGLTSDTWLAEVRGRCHAAEVIRMDSVTAAANHEDRSVWMVFIDGGHTEKQVAADIAAWLPKMVAEGWLLGHDLDHPRHPGVRAALEASGLGWHRIGRSSWRCPLSPEVEDRVSEIMQPLPHPAKSSPSPARARSRRTPG